ncbi:nibrin isoform X4 [Heterodontus francisci]|uniref:nibrin isoform X4 n=1 Tax=Heterodontus francisci TaxID=7792 RepID=UPI00355C4912
MWSLVPLCSAGEEPYRLLVGIDYVVGRKNCAILLRDDQSISRSHAALTVSLPAANLTQAARTSVLTLKDISKYGTFVNEERLQNDSPRILKSGEFITFGVFQSKFRVEYEPLIVCCSCLDGPGKIALNQSVQQLGGHLSSSWTEDNTHLVMLSVKVTVKTICAMICCRPIVRPEFFVHLTEAIRSRQRLPSPESFSPPIDEPSISPGDLDITVKLERKSIFRGKTFIFLNGKQAPCLFWMGTLLACFLARYMNKHKRLNSALTLGGGDVKLLENSGSNMSFLEAPGSCVIDVGVSDSQTVSNSAEKWIESVMRTLQRKGLRAIPEAEIGLAVLHNSTDIYCNPHNKPDHETCSTSRTIIPGPTLSQSVDMVDITAPDTSQVTAYVPDTQPSQEHSTREREETGSSQAKFAKIEEPNLSTDHQLYISDPALEKGDSKFTSQRTQSRYFSANPETGYPAEGLKGSSGGVSEEETANNNVPEKTEFVREMTIRKRKDPEDENLKDDMKLSRDELGLNKRRKVEPDVLSFNEKDESVAEGGIKASTSQVKQKSEIKHEKPAPLHKESNNYLELLHEYENNEALPSRLLLTVFKSLVVSQPGRERILASHTGDSQLKNFKKFRKVLYPGAEELPKIIGGTDLKAYQTKKSSEMEEWLRQEVEEQSQLVREENLADDLFRYDPKSVKRIR